MLRPVFLHSAQTATPQFWGGATKNRGPQNPGASRRQSPEFTAKEKARHLYTSYWKVPAKSIPILYGTIVKLCLSVHELRKAKGFPVS